MKHIDLANQDFGKCGHQACGQIHKQIRRQFCCSVHWDVYWKVHLEVDNRIFWQINDQIHWQINDLIYEQILSKLRMRRIAKQAKNETG